MARDLTGAAQPTASGQGPPIASDSAQLTNPTQPTDPPNYSANQPRQTGGGTPQPTAAPSAGNQKSFDRIRIASFNIKVFGKSTFIV